MIGVSILVIVFLLVVWQVQSGGALVTLDGAINAGLLPLRSRTTLAVGSWISQVGTDAVGAMTCLVATGLFLSDGRARLVLPLWIAFLGAEATTWLLKFITARVRPSFLDGITAASPSFPSAHSTVAMVVYGFLAVAIAQEWHAGRAAVFAVAGMLILLVCFSRMLLSLHYFSDVLAGALVGLFWVVVANWVATR